MSTHAALGIQHTDGKITGCYVQYDGATLGDRIEIFLNEKTTTDLTLLIAQAQMTGGIRSFYCPPWQRVQKRELPRETEFLDDNEEYVIDESNWKEDHYGAAYSYLVNYETGKIKEWSKY